MWWERSGRLASLVTPCTLGRTNPILQSYNKLGPEGAGKLAEALGRMTGMQSLDLVRKGREGEYAHTHSHMDAYLSRENRRRREREQQSARKRSRLRTGARGERQRERTKER